jgi:hypothetical protein
VLLHLGMYLAGLVRRWRPCLQRGPFAIGRSFRRTLPPPTSFGSRGELAPADPH